MKFLIALSAFLAVASAGSIRKCRHIIKERQACALFPESVEGPYFLENRPERSDITEGKAGVPLTVTLQVLNYTTCQPVSNLLFDLWSADAMGEYSGWHSNASDITSFRGYQMTNSSGWVTFQTIVPGWYEGRTVHIHVDAWLGGQKHVGQLYFTEQLVQTIARLSPYNSITTQRTTNAQDGIYNQYDGDSSLLSLSASGNGYAASLVMGVDPDSDGGGENPGPGPGPGPGR